MFSSMLQNVRHAHPLVHNITNYVTANDCANILLACGASPIMADDPQEAAQITAQCAGLHLNLGTLHTYTIPAMRSAGKAANRHHIPVVLDPVGVGASAFRMQTARALLDEIRFCTIRCNLSELRALMQDTSSHAQGVDASPIDRIDALTLDAAVASAKNAAKKFGCIIAVTSEIDIVADEKTAFCIRNGDARMRLVTGTGCQLSAMTTAYLAANDEHPLDAVAASVAAMGLCGQLAAARMQPQDGSGSYRAYMIDAVSNLTGEQLKKGADYEVR
jgi:hydroxyethylthiazole kinase